MKISATTWRIGIASAIILGTIGWLAYTGYGAGKSYFVTIPELNGMGAKAYRNQLRVEGFVKPGTIVPDGPNVTFILTEYESHSAKAAEGRDLKVVYKGSEPPPDTFKGDAMAVAEGAYGRDGVFHATGLQAKCASKYAPSQPLHPGEPAKPAPVRPATASASGTPLKPAA
ncbi:MAG: cytochrome c maturation protein CcmE [Terracidiphilus sp.]